MDGIALARSAIPEMIINRHSLNQSLVCRANCDEPEIHFMQRSRSKALPVWNEGELRIMELGSRGHSPLPRTCFFMKEQLESGDWSSFEPVPVEIPATYGFERGVWYLVPDAAIRGVLLNDEQGNPHVYMLMQVSTVYYKNMTRNPREPIFKGETI